MCRRRQIKSLVMRSFLAKIFGELVKIQSKKLPLECEKNNSLFF